MMNFSYGTKLEVFTDKVSSSVKIFNSEQVDYILCGVNKQGYSIISTDFPTLSNDLR